MLALTSDDDEILHCLGHLKVSYASDARLAPTAAPLDESSHKDDVTTFTRPWGACAYLSPFGCSR